MLSNAKTPFFLLIGFIFGVADLWHFHSLANQTDLGIVLSALAGAGISGAHTAGLNAASAAPPTAPPSPAPTVTPTPTSPPSTPSPTPPALSGAAT